MARNKQRRVRVEGLGFTLVELLVVVAIIAILISFLAAVVPGALRRAKQAACANNLNQLDKAYKSWAGRHLGNFPLHRPAVGDAGVVPSCVWKSGEGNLTASAAEQGAYVGPGALAYREYVDAGVMYCPAGRRQDMQYRKVNTTGNGTGPWWPASVMPAGQTRIQVSYMQRSTLNGNRSLNLADASWEPAMSDAFDEQAFLNEQHPDGFNVLYLSGSVKFIEIDPTTMTVPTDSSGYENVFTTTFARK